MTLNEAIADGFSYVRRTAPGTQTPGETLRSRKGSCRDFALLMMEAARSLGFAARFVTGYIYVPDRDGPGWLGGGSTHAWCQIYVPGSGWVEFDPTNGIVGNQSCPSCSGANSQSGNSIVWSVLWGSMRRARNGDRGQREVGRPLGKSVALPRSSGTLIRQQSVVWNQRSGEIIYSPNIAPVSRPPSNSVTTAAPSDCEGSQIRLRRRHGARRRADG
jgi:Transglutaminase-like superfamily